MSQDPLKRPEPARTKPQAPVSTRERVGRPTQGFRKASQTLEQIWYRSKPILVSQAIKLLRLVIRALGWVLLKLETELAKTTSTSASNQSAIATETLDTQVTSGVVPLVDPDRVSESSQPSPVLTHNQEQLPTGFERLRGWWSIALDQIRSRLPEAWRQRVSNQVLAGIVAAAFLLLLWTTVILPSRSPEVTSTPDTQLEPAKGLRVPAELNAQADQRNDQEVLPVPLESNLSPEPTATPEIEPELTREQKLLAAVKQQVTKLGNQYTTGLVQSVQADTLNHRLMLTLNPSWYSLSPDQQNQLVSELFGQARNLNFSKLEITDPRAALLARSPVVGPDMVILKRQA